MKEEIKQPEAKTAKSYIERGCHWFHDTVMLIGLLSIFLSLGGARWFGYYFDFALVPVELTEKIAKR